MYHKKLSSLALLVSVGFTNIAFADVASNNQSGFYVGVDAGATNLMDKESHSVNPESHQLNVIGPTAGILAGYDYGINAFWRIGIEAFANLTQLSADIKHAPDTYQVKQNYNFGLRLLPAYAFTPCTLGYLIFGYANGQFKINDNGVYGIVNNTFHQSGFQTGLGLTIIASKNVQWRLSSIYTAYSSSTTSGIGLTTPTQSYTNRFRQLSGELALIYKFT